MDLFIGETYADVFSKLIRLGGVTIHVDYNPLYLKKRFSKDIQMAVKISNDLGRDYSLLFIRENNQLFSLSGVYEWKRKVR